MHHVMNYIPLEVSTLYTLLREVYHRCNGYTMVLTPLLLCDCQDGLFLSLTFFVWWLHCHEQVANHSFVILLSGCRAGVADDQSTRVKQREERAQVAFELDKQKHILRQMQGRRFEKQSPGEFVTTKNPARPVYKNVSSTSDFAAWFTRCCLHIPVFLYFIILCGGIFDQVNC